MPSAKMSAGTRSISMTTAIIAPAPKSRYATGCRLMKPSTSAFMIEACGEASTTRVSPGAASPNWNVWASATMTRPTTTEDTRTPKNFTRSCAAGVEPSQ